MALPMAAIEQILTTKGRIKYDQTNVSHPYESGYAGSKHHKAYSNHVLCSSQVGVNELVLRGLPQGTPGATAINIAYMGDWFTFGKIAAPAYIYSDGFAGCSFYLYRSPKGEIWGVHASRELGKVCDPTDYFGQMGFPLLWAWHSLDQLGTQQLLAGHFSAVLCCVDLDLAYCYALSLKGQTVESIQERTVIVSWRNYTSRPSPAPVSKGSTKKF